MNSPEEDAVRDLGRFTANVLNGMIDLHRSAADLIRYTFQFRTIKDVVRRGSENSTLISQIFDSLNHLVIYLNEEIVDYSTKIVDGGMEERHFAELYKRIQLLYEIVLAMRVREEFQNNELDRHVQASVESVKLSYGKSNNFKRWNELTKEHKEFFLDWKEAEEVVTDVVEPTLFAREDGVVSSLSHEQAQSDEEGKKKQFVVKTEKVLNNYRANNPDYKTMRELIHSKTNFVLDGIFLEKLINEFISVWDMAIDQLPDNPNEKYLFLALLKKVFFLMNDKKRNELAMKLFNKYKKDANDVLPCLENFIENFQSGLTEALNQLPLDAAAISNDLELFDKSKDPLMWYLLVSPTFTLQQLMTMCVDNRGYVPIVIRICRTLPTLFDRSVLVTPLAFEEEKKEQLHITILHRIFSIGRTQWTSAAQWENAGAMTMSFTKCKKKKDGSNEVEEKSLLDSFSLVQFAIEELMKENRKPQKAVEIFVRMLQRILANNNNARMMSNYRLGNSFQDKGENVLPIPIILILMFELLGEYDGVCLEISDAAREILKSIGGRMSNENVVFDTETSIYLIEEPVFNRAPWWIKYSIYSWFSFAMNNPKRQVPSGVYQSLPESSKDQFEQIMDDETSMVSECYLRSLFELGLFDVDLAIDLLNQGGYNIKFARSDVVERMSLALVDSYGKKMSKRNGGLEIWKLIKEMLALFDPIRELAPLKMYSGCYFDSIKNIEHLLILFMAARVSKEKHISSMKVGTDDEREVAYDEVLSYKQVSDQLMDIFCETAKAHVEKEAAEVAKLRSDAHKLIFTPGPTEEKWKIMTEADEREQSLVLQLTMLYLNCSKFTRLYQSVPIKLQQLMNVTLDKQFESQKSTAKRVMDDVLTEQRKTEVVYAIVPQIDEKEPEKEVVQPVKPSDLLKNQRNVQGCTSAENVMFQMNSEEYRSGRGQNRAGRGNNRKTYSDQDRPSSSRAYRGNRWNGVNDTQIFNPRDREIVHLKSKYDNNDHPRDSSWKDNRGGYDQDKLYFDSRRSPFESDDVRVSSDARRCSESRDSFYDNSWEQRNSNRFPSESDFDDSEYRHIDKTIRNVRQFHQRDSYSSHAGSSCDSPPPQQGQEEKHQKGPKGTYQRRTHNNNNNNDRKSRYAPSNRQEEDGKKLMRGSHQEEDGFSCDRPHTPKHNRNQRGSHHHYN